MSETLWSAAQNEELANHVAYWDHMLKEGGSDPGVIVRQAQNAMLDLYSTHERQWNPDYMGEVSPRELFDRIEAMPPGKVFADPYSEAETFVGRLISRRNPSLTTIIWESPFIQDEKLATARFRHMLSQTRTDPASTFRDLQDRGNAREFLRTLQLSAFKARDAVRIMRAQLEPDDFNNILDGLEKVRDPIPGSPWDAIIDTISAPEPPGVAKFAEGFAGLVEKLHLPREEGGYFESGKPDMSEGPEFHQIIGGQDNTAAKTAQMTDRLRGGARFSEDVTDLWGESVDPEFVKSNRYIHWMDFREVEVDWLAKALGGNRHTGEINAMVYPQGMSLDSFHDAPFASSGVGILIEGDVRYISPTDAFSWPMSRDGGRRGISPERRFLPTSSRRSQTGELAIVPSDLLESSNPFNEAAVGNYKIRGIFAGGDEWHGEPLKTKTLRLIQEGLLADLNVFVPILRPGEDDPSQVVADEFVGQPMEADAVARESNAGGSQIAPPAERHPIDPDGQSQLFRRGEVATIPDRALDKRGYDDFTETWEIPEEEAPALQDQVRDTPHPDQLDLLDPEKNNLLDREVMGMSFSDLQEWKDTQNISPIEYRGLQEAWESGSRRDILKALQEADIITRPSIKHLQQVRDPYGADSYSSAGLERMPGERYSHVPRPGGRPEYPENSQGQQELFRNYTTEWGEPTRHERPTIRRAGTSIDEPHLRGQQDLFPEEATRYRQFEAYLPTAVQDEVDRVKHSLLQSGVDPYDLPDRLRPIRQALREGFRARFNESIAESRRAERGDADLIRRDARTVAREAASTRALDLPAVRQPAEVRAPSPQSEGPVRTMSPQESASLRRQATQAHQMGKGAQAWRILGILGDVAFAAQLGYNIRDQGSIGRGMMETGAQELEGTGSLMRGASYLPGLGPLHVAGNAVTSLAGAHRREQQRADNRGFAGGDYQSRVDSGLDPQESRAATARATSQRMESLQRGGTPVSMEPAPVRGRSATEAMYESPATELPDRETLLRNLGIRRQ